MVCADVARIESMLPEAEKLHKVTGIPYRIVQFTTRTDVTDFIKQAYGI